MKYIGINQRLPFEVLDAAIYRWLVTGLSDPVEVLNHMQSFTNGKNRASKAAKYVQQILRRQQPVLAYLQQKIRPEDYYLLPAQDRKVLGLCLIALTYPIVHALVQVLGSAFRVQSVVSRQTFSQKIYADYGSNRTVDIALDALIPMLIEWGMVKRERISMYAPGGPLTVTHPIVAELVIFTDLSLCGTQSMLSDDLPFRPWHFHFDTLFNPDLPYHLFHLSHASGLQYYLTIPRKE